MELKVAYTLMKGTGSDSSIDSYYNQLKTEIELLDETSAEFHIIEKYFRNTRPSAHKTYGLKIANVFTVKRQGEEERLKPFKKLHNHKLLWHGSRKTNFVGILSQGRRIAPPEAPVTGFMFGKAVYFADMVSKAASCCCADSVNARALMLLCEVALGEMYENTSCNYFKKLPDGKQNCKGVGRSYPDPKTIKKIGDARVPVGRTVTKNSCSSLLYNEYIVYDVSQIQIKYLLQVDFSYKF